MTTYNKRRRIFYIDRIFQKKLLILFLSLNVLIVLSNVIYYLTYLKGEVEDNLFRSHIVLSNINEIIVGNVIYFNIALVSVSLILAILFYTYARLKLRTFFNRVWKLIIMRQKEHRLRSVQIPEEFQEIDQVLGKFMNKIDRELNDEDRRIAALREAFEQKSSS